jgi:tetraacyldisaccharide 4'-kinase
MENLRSDRIRYPGHRCGNITVGGTEKPPMSNTCQVSWKTTPTAVLSRGYRRLSGGFVQAAPGVTAGQIGDEPLQIYKKFPHLTLAVDADRIRGIRFCWKRILPSK